MEISKEMQRCGFKKEIKKGYGLRSILDRIETLENIVETQTTFINEYRARIEALEKQNGN